MFKWLESPLMIPMWYAILCGTIVGLQRELKNKDAGIKTTIFICIGACLFTHIGTLIDGTLDHSRIISYIVGGVGFIGGGAIIKDNNEVSGLTSAVIIWVSSAIGVLCGLEYYLEAFMVSATTVFIDFFIDNMKNFFRKR